MGYCGINLLAFQADFRFQAKITDGGTMKLDPNNLPPFDQTDDWLKIIRKFLNTLASRKKAQFNRRVSIGDLLSERSDNATMCGFGEGSTMYDNVLVLGDVKVGRQTWIGPGCILDGSGGGLEIGDFCSISAGVQIYTHHTVRRSVSLGKEAVEYAPTKIGNGVYIGPNSVVQMGINIGDQAIIGANSFVNKDIPQGVKAFGNPAQIR
jgi:acetyltransferase-like isoleucine patch superfamily enzyme